MYKIQTRVDEETEVWDDVINTKLSKTKTVLQLFFSEEEANTFVKNNKMMYYRVVEHNDE
jgi:hypothetical protein